ncbi:MAG: M48 family metalloprotease [Pirellulales bacterium]|nr:M48 family metalloprotease [Pirellulales bacterium]
MCESQAPSNKLALEPLPYHQKIRDYLKTEEAEVWRWYASHKVRREHAEAVRFDLLKSTYRVDPETQPEIYEAAKSVAQRLSLDVPITIYQAQNPLSLNASLAYIPDEAHVVLHGAISSKLNAAEVRALLAHELSHFALWQHWDGEYSIVDQILSALTHDRLADTPHFASARLFGLYSEIFCDRGSLLAVDDPLAVVSMLVKVSTELEEVSAESYIRQAEEVFSRKAVKADNLTHPEAFIRARAIKLWSEGDYEADSKVEEMIEGRPALNDLDLLAQTIISGLTRRLVDVFLSPKWMQSDTVLAHARLFFEDYVAPESIREDPSLADDIKTDDEPMRDYYCYVLLDFVTSDRDLEEYPLASALKLSEQLGIKDRFAEIAARELRLRKKQLQKIDQDKNNLLAKAGQDTGSP